MARARLGPFCVILTVMLLAFWGTRLRVYETLDHVECAHQLSTLDRPAANVLFVGNSRMGAGIDPAYIEQLLDENLGQALTVERLALDADRPAQMQVFAGEYVRSRGNPDLVVLQLLYGGLGIGAGDIPIHSSRTIAYGRLEDLIDIQQQAQLNGRDQALSPVFMKDYETLPVVALHKFTTNVYSSLRIHARLIGQTLPDCSGNMLYQINQPYVYGTAAAVEGSPGAPEKGKYKHILERKAEWTGLEPMAPFRIYENHTMQQLLHLFEEGGSTVLIMFLPVIDEDVTPEEFAQVQAIFPGNQLIDTNGPLRSAMAAPERNYFREENHVTPHGTKIISAYLAEFLANYVRHRDGGDNGADRGSPSR